MHFIEKRIELGPLIYLAENLSLRFMFQSDHVCPIQCLDPTVLYRPFFHLLFEIKSVSTTFSKPEPTHEKMFFVVIRIRLLIPN